MKKQVIDWDKIWGEYWIWAGAPTISAWDAYGKRGQQLKIQMKKMEELVEKQLSGKAHGRVQKVKR